MNCAACKHWNTETFDYTFETPEGFGECDRFTSDYVNTRSPYEKAFIDPLDSHTGERFVTAPDFGCLAFEQCANA